MKTVEDHPQIQKLILETKKMTKNDITVIDMLGELRIELFDRGIVLESREVSPAASRDSDMLLY